MRSIPVNIVLTFAAIAVPTFLCDIYMKSQGFPKNNGNILLLSGGRLDSEKNGIRQFSKNSVIKHSAVYGKKLEYSYKFKTDSHGFRITHICKNEKPDDSLVAISGDSFTEGQGSSKVWTRTIQQLFCKNGYRSSNLGIAGYGVRDMQMSLSFAKKKLNAQKAIVAIVPQDIYRKHRPMTSNSECSSYGFISEQKCGDLSTWWHHEIHLTNKEIIELATARTKYGLIHALQMASQTARSSFYRLKTKKSERVQARIDLISDNIKAMNSIIREYGQENVVLVVLPSKSVRGLVGSDEERERLDADLKIFLNGINQKIDVVDIRTCELDKKHFHRLDGHPNERGHELLGKCAIENISPIVLASWETTK